MAGVTNSSTASPPSTVVDLKPSDTNVFAYFRFLDLPAELRDNIYRLCVLDYMKGYAYTDDDPPLIYMERDCQQPSVALVSKQVRKESLHIWYSLQPMWYTLELGEAHYLDDLRQFLASAQRAGEPIKKLSMTLSLGWARDNPSISSQGLVAWTELSHDFAGYIDLDMAFLPNEYGDIEDSFQLVPALKALSRFRCHRGALSGPPKAIMEDIGEYLRESGAVSEAITARLMALTVVRDERNEAQDKANKARDEENAAWLDEIDTEEAEGESEASDIST